MKHLTKIFLLGTAVLAAAACQRELVDVNPNFNPETDEVNAAFVMSVSTGSSSNTKMSADFVQKNDNFLGITDTKLLLYQTGLTTPFVSSTDGGNFKEAYELGTLFTAGSITPSLNATSSSNRIVQLTLPLGADAALFYGRAISGAPGKAQGAMEMHIANNPAETYFGPTRRIGDEDNVKKYDATARLMIYAINFILHTTVPEVASYTVNGYTCEAALDELTWPDLGHQWEVNNKDTPGCNPYKRTGVSKPQSQLARSMGQAYALFTHLKLNGEYTPSTDPIPNSGLQEFRAGSSASVKEMIQGLYSVLEHTAAAIPLNDEEANVVRLADKAVDNVNLFFASTWAYKDISTIKSSIVPAYMDETDWENTTTGFKDATNLNNYPYATFGIPEGAAQLTFNPSNDKFSYTHPNKALVTPGADFEPRKYIYPAELVYYVNSPLRVTSSSVQNSDFPNGTGPWNDVSATSKWTVKNWNVGKVESTTRGVAIRDNINYGVALLETNVTFTGDPKFEDNRKAMTGEDNNEFDADDLNFELRGVLIGGVHPRYNWQLIPRALTSTEASGGKYGTFDGVIYDDAVPSSKVPTVKPNYTLVYDNYDYSKDDDVAQNDVRVALEFVNRGDAFWGRDNLIPSDGVFYLGAKLTIAPKKLDPEHKTEDQAIVWPTDHQIPPIDETSGLSKQIPRVFIQDFLTKATFKIGKDSMKYAYYSVPDLATSQMSFGLSVDLSWETGYEYDIVFGANN